MQTFLPYPDFRRSMSVLDASRLGNQVYREGMTLIRGHWPNHPAARMWRDYHQALAKYLLAGVDELKSRGYDYTGRPWHQELVYISVDDPDMPPWLGEPEFHASHRAVLLWKDYEWYSQFGWTETPRSPRPDGSMDYVWPV